MVAETRNPQDLRHWVCWQLEARDGKPTKVPYSPTTGERASSTDPKTWASHSEAVRACRERSYSGVGFVFTAEDDFAGVDLDGCLDPKTGEIETWAQELIEELNSYTEISPSGIGLHILVKAQLPPGRNRKGRIEFYDRGRYFTVTGQHLAGTPHTIESRQEQLARVAQCVFGTPESANGRKKSNPKFISELSDKKIIEKASIANNGGKFRRLWAGDTSGYASDSEADLALCSILAFWVGPDEQCIDRLFRLSARCREKWTRRADYRERTFKLALNRAEFWRGGKAKIYALKREVVSIG
jgi:putative DNA primase/helicase